MDFTQHPLTQARALSPEFYSDRGIYKAEMSALLPQSWQIIAPESAIAAPGDIISRKIGNIPIP